MTAPVVTDEAIQDTVGIVFEYLDQPQNKAIREEIRQAMVELTPESQQRFIEIVAHDPKLLGIIMGAASISTDVYMRWMKEFMKRLGV